MNGEVETMIAGQLLDVTLIDGITYVEYGNIKIKFNLANLETIISGIKEYCRRMPRTLIFLH